MIKDTKEVITKNWDYFNKRRKDRYDTDPTYRDRVKEYNRKNQRKNGVVLGQKQIDPAKNLKDMESYGDYRVMVLPDGSKRAGLCFSTHEFADLVGFSRSHVYRFYGNNQIPRPEFTAYVLEPKRMELLVYSEEEVRAIINCLKNHYEKLSYFRKDHKNTIARLHHEVTMARRRVESKDKA